MNGKFLGVMLLLSCGFMTLILPTAAKGVETFGPNTGLDENGNSWTMTVTVEQGGCTDNRGNPIPCTKFMYAIAPPPATGGNVIQAAEGVPASCNGADPIKVVGPADSSVKIRSYDPNTGYLQDVTELNALTWDALKGTADPYDHLMIAVYTTPASVRDTTMLLVTEFGYVFIPTKGPGCCSSTQNATKILFEAPADSTGSPFFTFGPYAGASGNIVVQYDQCSGDAAGVVEDPTTLEEPQPVPYTSFNTLYTCLGTADSYDVKTCAKSLKAGPEDGFVAYAGKVYFGFGGTFWKGPTVTPAGGYNPLSFNGCSTNGPDSYKAYSQQIFAWYEDGSVCDVTYEEEPLPTSVVDYDPLNSIVDGTARLWVCEGKVSKSTCSVVYYSPFNMSAGSCTGSFAYWAYKYPWLCY